MKKIVIIISSIVGVILIGLLITWLVFKFTINKTEPVLHVQLPKKTEYYVGEKYQFDDMVVYIDDNGERIDINDYEIVGFDSSKPISNLPITVKTTYEEVEYSYIFYVNIKELPTIKYVVGIEMQQMPKTTYYVGESFDCSNGIIKVLYNDGTYYLVNLLPNYVYGFDSSTPGNYEVLVKYKDSGKYFETKIMVEIIFNETI